jgi:hypothetical protein
MSTTAQATGRGEALTTKASHSRRAEEPFILAAVLSLVATMVWLAIRPDTLQGHFYRIPVFAVTHLLTLGWLSSLIMGVLLRLTPMALGIEPRRKPAYVLFLLWLVGGSGVISHMAGGEWFGVWTSAVLLLVGAGLLFIVHPGLLLKAREGDWTARYAVAAMSHLVLAVLVGLFIGLNKHLGWVRIAPYQILGAHFHLAEVGWVTFMIFGFGRKLLPALAPPRSREPWESLVRFWSLEIGLLVLVLALILKPNWVPLGATIVVLSILLHLSRPIAWFLSGETRDRASFWAVISLFFFLLAAVLGLALAWGVPRALAWPTDRLLIAYGFIALVGWNTLAITAFGMKIFPLWVWQERFAEDLGKKPIPAVSGLYSHRIQIASGVMLTVGTLVTTVGFLSEWDAPLVWGLRITAVGALLFVANFMRAARWALLPISFRPGPEDWAKFNELYGGEGKPPAQGDKVK